MKDLRVEYPGPEEWDLEERERGPEGGAVRLSGKRGPEPLEERLVMFAEERARHGDSMTQPQYAARFGVSDRTIRRWLDLPEVQNKIRELERAALIDPSNIEHLTQAQRQELRDRLDQIEGRKPEERLPPILADLRSYMMNLDEDELSDVYAKAREIMHDVMVDRGRWSSYREETLSEILSLIGCIEQYNLKRAGIVRFESIADLDLYNESIREIREKDGDKPAGDIGIKYKSIYG